MSAPPATGTTMRPSRASGAAGGAGGCGGALPSGDAAPSCSSPCASSSHSAPRSQSSSRTTVSTSAGSASLSGCAAGHDPRDAVQRRAPLLGQPLLGDVAQEREGVLGVGPRRRGGAAPAARPSGSRRSGARSASPRSTRPARRRPSAAAPRAVAGMSSGWVTWPTPTVEQLVGGPAEDLGHRLVGEREAAVARHQGHPDRARARTPSGSARPPLRGPPRRAGRR